MVRRFLIVAVLCLVAVGFLISVQAYSRHSVAERQTDAKRQLDEAAHKRKNWEEHLKREAWNKAHPEIVEKRRQEALAKQRAQLALQQEQRRSEAAAAAAQREHDYRVAHACDISNSEERKAMTAVDAGDYRSAYAIAQSGLSHLDLCQDDDTVKNIDRGWLLSAAGFAAHGIGRSEEARTDFNQANQLLVECQTTPGIYGTRAAANCETQEQYNIRAQTNWDLEDAEQQDQ
jgi:hypothetical protein